MTGVGPPAGKYNPMLTVVSGDVPTARARWRSVNAPNLVALVRAEARFERGLLVERQDLAA